MHDLIDDGMVIYQHHFNALLDQRAILLTFLIMI